MPNCGEKVSWCYFLSGVESNFFCDETRKEKHKLILFEFDHDIFHVLQTVYLQFCNSTHVSTELKKIQKIEVHF